MDRYLQPYTRVKVMDFEFQQPPGDMPVPHCCVVRDIISGKTTRHWIARSPDKPAGGCPYSADEETLLVTFYGCAEVQCLIALGWPLPRYHLDLYAEFRHLTNGPKQPEGNSLLAALSFFGIGTMGVAEKEQMRSLAIRGGPFTEDEKTALLDYCQEDVLATAKLFEAMRPQIDLPRALIRGRYMNTVGQMQCNGIPVNNQRLQLLGERWQQIMQSLIGRVDAGYGVYEGISFRAKRWLEWTAAQGIPWPLLKTGAPILKQDTFKEMAKAYPAVLPIKELRATVAQMRAPDLPIGADGRNRAFVRPFSSVTGRNQPKTTESILGRAKWMRGFIQPEPHKALAMLDWTQQEFGIAAALSRDKRMMEAYQTGDPYLAFAKQAGAVPEDATKESHPQERERFKSCALGVQYGMQKDSLAVRIGQTPDDAQRLLDLHRATYPNYWKWSQGVQDYAYLERELTAAFGWRRLVERKPDAKTLRSLRNFPVQANGSEMLRLACIFAAETGVKLNAPLHDALLIEADAEEIDNHVHRCREAMHTASSAVLNGFVLGVDCQIIRYPDHYPVNGSQLLWDEVNRLLDEPPA